MLGLVLGLLLAGCGKSAASTVEAKAKADFKAGSATCRKVGLMFFVGKQTRLYDCQLRNVDVAHRPISQIQSMNLDRCFVIADGDGYDVTAQVVILARTGQLVPTPRCK